MIRPVSLKAAESAKKALCWRGSVRWKEQGNGRDLLQAFQMQARVFLKKNTGEKFWSGKSGELRNWHTVAITDGSNSALEDLGKDPVNLQNFSQIEKKPGFLLLLDAAPSCSATVMLKNISLRWNCEQISVQFGAVTAHNQCICTNLGCFEADFFPPPRRSPIALTTGSGSGMAHAQKEGRLQLKI